MGDKVPYSGNVDKDGFYINKSGQQIFLLDEEGNYFFEFRDGTIIKFHSKDSRQSRLAGDKLAEKCADGFDKAMRDSMTLAFSESGKMKLAERGFRSGNNLEMHRINMYLDGVNKFLNYLGNAGGFDFKKYVYLKFKDKIKNSFLSVKSGLYGTEIPKSRVEFVNEWLEYTDREIEQEGQRISNPFKKTTQEQSKAGSVSKRKPDIEKIEKAKAILRDKGTANPTQKKIYNLLQNNGLNCSESWVKKHYNKIIP